MFSGLAMGSGWLTGCSLDPGAFWGWGLMQAPPWVTPCSGYCEFMMILLIMLKFTCLSLPISSQFYSRAPHGRLKLLLMRPPLTLKPPVGDPNTYGVP